MKEGWMKKYFSTFHQLNDQHSGPQQHDIEQTVPFFSTASFLSVSNEMWRLLWGLHLSTFSARLCVSPSYIRSAPSFFFPSSLHCPPDGWARCRLLPTLQSALFLAPCVPGWGDAWKWGPRVFVDSDWACLMILLFRWEQNADSMSWYRENIYKRFCLQIM